MVLDPALGGDGGGRDLLDDRASSLFWGLLKPDLTRLEHGRALNRHARYRALMMRLAGHEPAATADSDLPHCAVTLVAMVITACWQIVAVVVSAHENLKLSVLDARVLVIGILVAVLVVSFDWQMISDHVHGRKIGRVALTVRITFIACMMVLVSEAVATAYFSPDIARQQAIEGKALIDQTRQQLGDLQRDYDAARDKDQDLTADAQQALVERNRARDALNSLPANAPSDVRQQAHRRLDEAQRVYANAVHLRENPATGTAAVDTRVRALDAQLKQLQDAGNRIDAAKGGAAAREAALWHYLFANPGAFVIRIPMFLICALLDALLLIIGTRTSEQTRRAHEEWIFDRDEARQFARRNSGGLMADIMTRISVLIDGGTHSTAEANALYSRVARMIWAQQREAAQRESYRAREETQGEAARHGTLPHDPVAGPAHDPVDVDITEPVEAEARARMGAGDAGAAAGPGPEPSRGGSGRGGGTSGGPVGPEPDDDAGAWQSDPDGDPDGVDTSAPINEKRRRKVMRPSFDPGGQEFEYLRPYLQRKYGSGAFEVYATEPLTRGAPAVGRATLLRGTGPSGEAAVKLFAALGSAATRDEDTQRSMTRDSVNASKMSHIPSDWLAPSQFGTTLVDGQQVSFLVMPFYPAGSILDYLHVSQDRMKTVDWCLLLSEKMFTACADLARQNIVACDAKLANFVLTAGAGRRDLTEQVHREIGMNGLGPYAWADPQIRLIDLSMVFFRDDRHDPHTRSMRGTSGWSSPRAVNSADRAPFVLSSLDDAYTIAVNSMYLFMQENPSKRFGRRCELELLAPQGDAATRQKLLDLSHAYQDWADIASQGHRGDDWLRTGRAWFQRRHGLSAREAEDQACELAAAFVREIRLGLPEPVRRKQFVSLRWAPDENEPGESS